MNPRLLTPAIALICFGAAFGLLEWHAGLWRTAAAQAPIARVSAPHALPEHRAEKQALPLSLPPALSIPAPPPQVAAQVAESEGFLDARDRAMEHGARSH